MLAALAARPALAADGEAASLVEVQKATIAFEATTNISAVSVHGKSTALKAEVRLHRDAKQLVVDELIATVPVESLSTGMGLRDEHMKKYVFTTPDGKVPELKFRGANLTCPLEAGKETTCKLAGMLTVRGVERPLTVALKVRPASSGSGFSYRAAGDGVVKLSDYGIERPSQLGVKCADEVKIRIEFQAQESAGRAARIEAGN